MKSGSNKYARIFLTLIGIGLLIFAMIINHYHPRNAGVATATHGYINNLALNVNQAPTLAGSASKIQVIQLSYSGNKAAEPPAVAGVNVASSNESSAVPSVSNATCTSTSDDSFKGRVDESASHSRDRMKHGKASVDDIVQTVSDAGEQANGLAQSCQTALNSN